MGFMIKMCIYYTSEKSRFWLFKIISVQIWQRSMVIKRPLGIAYYFW